MGGATAVGPVHSVVVALEEPTLGFEPASSARLSALQDNTHPCRSQAALQRSSSVLNLMRLRHPRTMQHPSETRGVFPLSHVLGGGLGKGRETSSSHHILKEQPLRKQDG